MFKQNRSIQNQKAYAIKIEKEMSKLPANMINQGLALVTSLADEVSVAGNKRSNDEISAALKFEKVL